jgi:hypothetical protein
MSAAVMGTGPGVARPKPGSVIRPDQKGSQRGSHHGRDERDGTAWRGGGRPQRGSLSGAVCPPGSVLDAVDPGSSGGTRSGAGKLPTRSGGRSGCVAAFLGSGGDWGSRSDSACG